MIEHTPNNQLPEEPDGPDFINADLARIAEALMERGERIEELEATIHRYAGGLNAFLWELEKFPAAHSAVLTPKMASAMLDSIGVYAETGRQSDAIRTALGEIT